MDDGMYQLNDYNGCIFPSWNPEKNEYCNGDYVRKQEKADVFNLGRLFNYMLRGKYPHDDPTTVKSPKNSTHPFDIIVKRAMNMCLREHHATAKQIAKVLHVGYTKFKRSEISKGVDRNMTHSAKKANRNNTVNL